jgi:hypothetical protein
VIVTWEIPAVADPTDKPASTWMKSAPLNVNDWPPPTL